MKEKDTLVPIVLGVLVGLVACVISFPGLLFAFGCSSTNSCAGNPPPTRTSIPTLPAATMPAPKVGADAIASAPKCHIEAVKLIGAWVTAGYAETKSFTFTDLKGITCSATFTDDVQPLFNTPNLWFNGSPACTTCHFADVKKSTKNMDLSSYAGVLAGSGRANGEPKGKDILGGGNWDQALLYQMLYAPNGQTLINRPAMPFGRSSIVPAVPANGPVVAAGSPGGSATAAEPAATTAVDVARPSNPGDAGQAAKLTGDPVKGAQIFATNCAACHGAKGVGGVANPGSDDGTVPPLNPIDSTLVNADTTVFAYNLDLFLEHGSTPAGGNPTLKMPAWGDTKKLLPQQIADAIAYVMSLNAPAPAGASTTETPVSTAANTPAATEAAPDIARPSNTGGAGLAITLTGNAATGKQLFVANCQVCHGVEGKGGVANPGSDDGTVPTLNPIDPTLVSADGKVFSYNLDLFLEHGSAPKGDNPTLKMPAWGDTKKLLPQQIADAIAYVMSLNAPAPAGASTTETPVSTAANTPAATEAAPDIARPSNTGGAGLAITLTGNTATGKQLFVANCQVCHGVEGKGGVANPGSDDGTVPTLNPIDPTLVSADGRVFSYNLDLFLEHGSAPEGDNPTLKMPAWGDTKKLLPQQIADAIAYVMSLNAPAPASGSTTETPVSTAANTPAATEAAPDIARPSNTGGAGLAITLTGNAATGKQLFVANCQVCHGVEGKGGVANPGSDDGTVPTLNPIDPTLVSADGIVFSYNLDLFLEHGSAPEGDNPTLKMPAWGDQQKLLPQQIADLIAYVMSLNSP